MRTLKLPRVLTRVFSALMVVSLLTMSVAVPMVSAQADGTISIEDVTLQDTPKTIPIRLINMQDWGTLNLTLSWDTSVVDVAISYGADGIAGNINEATATMNFFNAVGYDGNAVLAYLTLTPLKPNSSTTITITVNTLTNTVPTPLTDYALFNGDVTVLAPSEVWVDKTWCGSDPGDTVGDGYTFGYNAFCDIQDGIDALYVAESGTQPTTTVNVLVPDFSSQPATYYSSFNVTTDNVQVIGHPDGEDLPIVDGLPEYGVLVAHQAGVYADGVLIQDLEFSTGAGYGSFEALAVDGDAFAIYCHNSFETELRDLVVYGYNVLNGIAILGGQVDVYNPLLVGCPMGIAGDSGFDLAEIDFTLSKAIIGIYDAEISAGSNLFLSTGTSSPTAGIVLVDTDTTINGASIDGYMVGIVAAANVNPDTTSIQNADVSDCVVGILVMNEETSIVDTDIADCILGVMAIGSLGTTEAQIGIEIPPYETTVSIDGGSIVGGTFNDFSVEASQSFDWSMGVYSLMAHVVMTGTEITGHDGWGETMAGSAAEGVSAILSEFGALQGEPIDLEDYIFGVGVRSGMYSTIEMYDCCDIHDNDVGVFAWGIHTLMEDASVEQSFPESLAIANNSNIHGNDNWGVFNFWGWYDTESPDFDSNQVPVGEPYWLDFTQNYWGSPTGPDAPDHDGQGDTITTYVDYGDWLATSCGKPAEPAAKFTASSVRAATGASIAFKDISTPTPGCTIRQWLWEFGDGGTSTAQNPSHTYRRPGTYSVKLTVWDSCQNSASYTMRVTIASGEEDIEPAKLGVSYLNIDPAQVLANQEVIISANICNSGEERGSKTVSLMLNGQAIDSQSVAVSGGACQQVVFKTSRAVPGTYQVAVDGMVGQFSVLAPRTVTNNVPSQQDTGLGTAGIIAIIAVLIVLILALIMVFKRD